VAEPMSVVIHHNPDCGTSRNVLALIEAAGYRPTVIEYLKTGWTRPQLLGLFAAAGLTPRQALRETKSPAAELGLLDPTVDGERLLAAMIEHPILVNRPIVCTAKGEVHSTEVYRDAIGIVSTARLPERREPRVGSGG
jgi:arsenate reductase (glutaredoxin)